MSRIVIQLLDPAQGHPLQTWIFDDRLTITIGRGLENDIVVADPYVSRAHAYLQQDAEGWRLISTSPQGLRFQGLERAELRVSDGTVCRLGPHGCLLRVGQSVQQTDETTMAIDYAQAPMLALDGEKLRSEVNQIARGEYFEALKNTARQLRAQRLAR